MTELEQKAPRRPRSRPETIQKREAILKAAIEVFGSRGYANASLAEIAEKVGLTHAGVLHHFGSKQSLLLEAVRTRDTSDLAEQGRLRMPEGRAQFDHLIKTAFRNSNRPGIVQAFVVLSSEAITDESPTRDYFKERYVNLREEISENFKALCESEGITDSAAINNASASILAVMDGLQYQWVLEPDAVNLGEATEFAIRAIVDAVLGPEGPTSNPE